MQLPEEYQKHIQEIFKDNYADYLKCLNDDFNHALRVNTNKIEVADFLKRFPYKLRPIPWIDNGFYYQKDDPITKHPYYYAGLYYLQDASAMTPAFCLPIDEDDIVLDACAAPGGKTSELAAKLKNKGILIANDISSSRLNPLIKTIERFGFENCLIISEDLLKLKNSFKGYFDKILLDAPCSGEGMFRKEPSIIKDWKNKGYQYYSSIQKELLIASLEMLKDGGYLLYSTCTFAKEENEEVLEYAFKQFNNLELVDINTYDGFERGFKPFEKAIRLYPFKLEGEGHFLALIKKKGLKEKTQLPKETNQIDNPSFLNFMALCNKKFSNLEIINNQIYAKSPHSIDTKNLRVMRSFLKLGEIDKGVFKPSQALAFNLKKDEFKKVINFKVDDINIYRYLKGETIEIVDKELEGWVLILVEEFPLGFAKAKNGILKNKLYKGYHIC